MLYPTTTRGLLGIFSRSADLPANDPRATNPPVRLPTSSSLRAILAAGAGVTSVRGGASGRRGLREEGRGGTGEGAESQGWSGRSDKALEAETEEDRMTAGEQGLGNNTLTESPWSTQESGSRGIRVDARAGRSDERKSPSATADEAGMRGRHGARQGQGDKNGGRQEFEGAEPSGAGGNNGGHEASRVDPETHRVRGEEGDHKASRVAENPGGGRH